MRHWRIGLVGFGFMGKTHLYAIRQLPFFYKLNELGYTAEVVAVCASSLESAEMAAKTYGIPRAVADAAALIADPDIDVIDICSPNPSHYAVARDAILAGKHVLCEKPLTVTVSEAQELCALARAQGVICGTVFNNRFLLPVMRARELIDEGRIGRILSFDFTYRHNSCIDPTRRAGWKQNADFGGGTLADLGPHVIDLCHYLCGESAWVSGRSQIAFPTHLAQDGSEWRTNADEAFYLLCGTRAGAVGNITVSKLTQGANDELTFSIWGERGALSFSLMQPNYLNFYDATAPAETRGYTQIECVGRYPSPASGFPTVKAPQGWLRGHIGCMQNYLSAVTEGRMCEPSFADGLYVQKILKAAYQSDREGRTVRLMSIIGLTGPSGAGKGTVASLFARHGVPSIDTDAVYHDLLVPPSACLDELVEHFGTGILSPDGTLNRPALAAIVFAPGHEDMRHELNAITHSHVLSRVNRMLAEYREAGVPAVLVDAPQLFESGYNLVCDRVLSVLAPREVRLSRVMTRDGLSEERASARLNAQLSDEVFHERSDHVIVNDGTPEALEAAVLALLAEWRVPHEV